MVGLHALNVKQEKSFAGTSWIFLKLHPDKIQIQFESVDSRGILDKFALCLSVGEWQN